MLSVDSARSRTRPCRSNSRIRIIERPSLPVSRSCTWRATQSPLSCCGARPGPGEKAKRSPAQGFRELAMRRNETRRDIGLTLTVSLLGREAVPVTLEQSGRERRGELCEMFHKESSPRQFDRFPPEKRGNLGRQLSFDAAIGHEPD